MRSTKLCVLTAALLAAGACSPAGHPAAGAAIAKTAALPFIENDWPAALARARAAQLPVFVEVWAPW